MTTAERQADLDLRRALWNKPELISDADLTAALWRLGNRAELAAQWPLAPPLPCTPADAVLTAGNPSPEAAQRLVLCAAVPFPRRWRYVPGERSARPVAGFRWSRYPSLEIAVWPFGVCPVRWSDWLGSRRAAPPELEPGPFIPTEVSYQVDGHTYSAVW